MPGFDIVAEEVGFDEALLHADIVITGEGQLDDTSFSGKVVGSVVDYANEAHVPVHAIVGDIDSDMLPELRSEITATSLTENYGADMSMQQVLRCIEDAARDILRAYK